jgi:hypothetical protein
MADDPALAGAYGASVLPAILEVLGLKGISRAKNATQAKRQMAEEIANGDLTTANIAKTLDKDGKLITNPRTQKLKKLFPTEESGVQAALTFEQLTPGDKRQVSKMLEMVQEGRKKGRAYVMENRPADVIGEGISSRVQRLVRIREGAKNQMTGALKELRKKPVDLAPEANRFIQDLTDLGITISRKDNGGYSVSTQGAQVRFGDNINAKDIELLLDNLDRGSFNGADGHKIKQLAQEIASYDNALTGRKTSAMINDAVKGLAADINAKIRPLSKSYAKANDKYSSMADVLSEAQKRLGNIDLESELANKRFGNLAKRIASNFTSRDDIIALVDGLDNALAENGVKMKTNVKMQVAALAELEELFQLERGQSPFGFQGRIEGALRTAREGAVDQTALAARGVDAAISKLREWRAPDFDERIAAVKRMLEEN